MKNKIIWKLSKDMYLRFINHDLVSTGAQITFFLLLSLFPFLIFFITLISYTRVADIQENIQILMAFMPLNAYEIVREMISETVKSRSSTLLSFGMLFSLWSSSSGVTSMIRGINKAYDQEETRPLWKVIAISLFFTLELTVVIIFSLLFIVFGNQLSTYLSYFFRASSLFLIIIRNIRYIIVFITIIFVFISLYRITPNLLVKMREAAPGAIFAAIGWVIISFAFSYYADNFGTYSKIYGSLGGIIVLLTWIHLSSIIILMGAELNASLMFSKTNRQKEKLKIY